MVNGHWTPALPQLVNGVMNPTNNVQFDVILSTQSLQNHGEGILYKPQSSRSSTT